MAFFSTSARVKTSRGGHKQFLFVLMFMHLEIHIKSIFGSSSTFLCTVMVSNLHPPKMEEKKENYTFSIAYCQQSYKLLSKFFGFCQCQNTHKYKTRLKMGLM